MHGQFFDFYNNPDVDHGMRASWLSRTSGGYSDNTPQSNQTNQTNQQPSAIRHPPTTDPAATSPSPTAP